MNQVRERHLPEEADPMRYEDLGMVYECLHDWKLWAIFVAIVVLAALAFSGRPT